PLSVSVFVILFPYSPLSTLFPYTTLFRSSGALLPRIIRTPGQIQVPLSPHTTILLKPNLKAYGRHEGKLVLALEREGIDVEHVSPVIYVDGAHHECYGGVVEPPGALRGDIQPVISRQDGVEWTLVDDAPGMLQLKGRFDVIHQCKSIEGERPCVGQPRSELPARAELKAGY